MQDLTKFTKGQKEAMLKSLLNAKSNTIADNKLKFALMDDLAEGDKTASFGIIVCMGYAKMINIDTFGEAYREVWAKIRTTSKGDYINNSYTGGRMYLN